MEKFYKLIRKVKQRGAFRKKLWFPFKDFVYPIKQFSLVTIAPLNLTLEIPIYIIAREFFRTVTTLSKCCAVGPRPRLTPAMF